jgi:hypothetical protein
MTDEAPLIEYGLEGPGAPDLPTDRFLRRIVGWAAIVYSAKSLITSALDVALAKKWLASPSSMAWELDGGWTAVVRGADTLATCVLLLGGVLLLRRSRAGVVLIRAGIACLAALSALSLAMQLYTNSTYASYWSTFGAAAMETSSWLSGFWPEAMLILLTLPPLARRML